ncbi:MAG: 50S ribosome-binding GTPase [Planctomycetes bacterium]|nr:50S ribosome-binding GTPase [Planctomycetota bacterium]
MNLEDTIVAVSSPAGAGERAIIRLSGPRALAIAGRLFTPGAAGAPYSVPREHTGGSARECAPPPTAGNGEPGTGNRKHPCLFPVPRSRFPAFGRLAEAPTYTAHTGRLEPPGSGLSAPATAYVMRAPRSYTRQDVVEFHVGAWPALEGPLVAAVVTAGARPAEPGEFTFRALMNGRLDLAQAEAVMAVVAASSAAALRAAEDLLGGHLSREVALLAGGVREALARVEADLDFSDQDIELTTNGGERGTGNGEPEASLPVPCSPFPVPGFWAAMAARLDGLRQALTDLGRRSRGIETASGRVRLVVAGRPNAGKSSLFNRLLEADRAIVSPMPGTTRDELRAALHIGGLEFALSDIAGAPDSAPRNGREPGTGNGEPEASLPVPCSPFPVPGFWVREAGDDPDAKAQAKALEAIGRADLVILALDATAPSYERMEELLGLIAVPMVVVVTKCDLAPPDRALAWLSARGEEKGTAPFFAVEGLATSAVTGEGIDALRAALVRAVEGGSVDRQAAGPVLAARHRAALEQAAVALARAAELARRAGGGELVALELRESLHALGAIVGDGVDRDVLDLIFSRFCIGK